MLSSIERFGFLGLIYIHTYYNLFQNNVPTAANLFDELLRRHDKNPYAFNQSTKTIKIREFKISNSKYAEILFQMTDPSIPDHVLSDRDSGDLRTAERKQNEDPAISAHVLIDLNSPHDQRRSYPTCIENIDYLPRSLIIRFFNEWMAGCLSEERTDTKTGKKKTFRPVVNFIAPLSQTIEQLLDNGGTLNGVQWVEEKLEDNALGDKAYPIQRRKDVRLKVMNMPTGPAAKEILRTVLPKDLTMLNRSIKVTIEDNNDRLKTIAIDPSKNNVLSNVFIPQAHFSGFNKPLKNCESNLRVDLLEKMKKALIT